MTTRRNLPPSTVARTPLRLAALTLAIGSSFAGGAHAATFTVTTTIDSGVGSLRWAVQQANETPGADEITFAVAGTIQLEGSLPINEDVAIQGPGRDLLSIDAQANSRVFDIWQYEVPEGVEGVSPPPLAVSIEGLTLQNGYGQGKGSGDSAGGCIRAASTALTLIDSRVTGCESRGRGGAIALVRQRYAYGEIIAPTRLLLQDTEITDNRAYRAGGGVSAYLRGDADGTSFVLQDSTVSGNVAGYVPDGKQGEGYGNVGAGGGIEIYGYERFDLELRDSVISDNRSNDFGGAGVILYQPDATGSVLITGTTFEGNLVTALPNGSGPFATGGGGASLLTAAPVRVESSTFVLNASIPEMLPVRGAPFNVGAGGGLLVYPLQGLPTLDIVDSRFDGNSALIGGGLAVLPQQSSPKFAGKRVRAGAEKHWSHNSPRASSAVKGTIAQGVRIDATSMSANAGFIGAGAVILAIRQNGPTPPPEGVATAPVVISRSTLSANVGLPFGPPQTPALAMASEATVSLVNSTVSGNVGGGVAVQAYGASVAGQETALIDHATIVDNGGPGFTGIVAESPPLAALLPGGKAYPAQDRRFALRNSVLHGNVAEDNAPEGAPGTGDIVVGDVADLHLLHVLTGMPAEALVGHSGSGNQFGVADPLLGDLADNGGPTLTHLPLAGSPLIDAGDPAFQTPPTTDQRGEPRVSGAALDIGAVETLGAVPGTVQFDPSAVTVDEDAGTVTLTLTRTGGDDGAVSVDWATSDATATAGADYTAGTGTVQWADGDAAAKTFTVAILDDTLVEIDETFTVALDGAEGGIDIGDAATATVTIVSDDVEQRGVALFDPTQITVDEDAGTAIVTMIRSGGSDGLLAVNYDTVGDTATAGADFTTTGGTLTWPDGDTAPRSFSVPIIDDTQVEGDESFVVTSSYPVGSPDDPSQLNTARVTILDNDVAPPDTVGFIGADEDGVLRLRVNESGTLAAAAAKGVLVLSVERAGNGAGAASVNFATVDGTATAPSDYASTSGTLAWADGDTSARTIALSIVEDTSPPEPDETFSVVLSNAVGVGLEGLQADIVIVANGVVEPPPASVPNVIPVNDWRGRIALFGAMLLGAFVALRRRVG